MPKDTKNCLLFTIFGVIMTHLLQQPLTIWLATSDYNCLLFTIFGVIIRLMLILYYL